MVLGQTKPSFLSFASIGVSKIMLTFPCRTDWVFDNTGVLLVSLQCDVSGVVARIHANLSDATIRCEQVMSANETKARREGEGGEKNEEILLADRSFARSLFSLVRQRRRGKKQRRKKALVSFDCVRKIDDVSLDAQLCALLRAQLYFTAVQSQADSIGRPPLSSFRDTKTRLRAKRERHKIE